MSALSDNTSSPVSQVLRTESVVDVVDPMPATAPPKPADQTPAPLNTVSISNPRPEEPLVDAPSGVRHSAAVMQPSTMLTGTAQTADSGLPGALEASGVPFDLTGVWQLDLSQSESSRALLLAMGATADDAAAIDALGVTATIKHSVGLCEVHSALLQNGKPIPGATAETAMILDRQKHPSKQASGEMTTYRAAVIFGATAVPQVSEQFGIRGGAAVCVVSVRGRGIWGDPPPSMHLLCMPILSPF
jgi:hypothetical protein